MNEVEEENLRPVEEEILDTANNHGHFHHLDQQLHI